MLVGMKVSTAHCVLKEPTIQEMAWETVPHVPKAITKTLQAQPTV